MRAARSLAVVVVVASLAPAATCTCETSPPPVPPFSLDTVLGPGEVRCGPVTKATELIGGPAAFAQVGRSFRCHNARIRFIVQDASRPVGNSVEGGTLIDIDRVNVDEISDGDDTFREFVPILGANEVKVESIEVVNDGQNGEPGIIRVSGRPTIVTLAPQADALRDESITGTIFTDYILAADSDVIEITTTLVNEGELVRGTLGADFLVFGGATPPMTPQFGFGDLPLFEQVGFLAGARGKHSNIALVCDDNDLIVPLVESGATVGICEGDLFIGSEGGFTRFLLVGDGSLDSVARPAYARRGVATAVVRGVVAGAVSGTVVSVVAGAAGADLAAAGAHVVNEAHVRADGSYDVAVPVDAVDVVVVAHVPGVTGAVVGRSAVVAVDVAGGADRVVDLALAGAGRVRVSTAFVARDGSDEGARPAKLTLVPQGDTERPQAVLHAFDRDGVARYEVSVDGAFDVSVPAGRYRAYVSRGFEYSRHEVDVDVAAGAVVDVDATLQHVVDTDGLLAGEFHQHTLGSIDAVVPVPLKVMENAVEGIEVAVSTDHDNIVDFAPFVDELGLTPFVRAFVGEEVSYQAIGHFNAYPFILNPADPQRDVGSRLWWFKTLPQLYADMRAAMGNDGVVQLNHPRSGGTGALASMRFSPADATLVPRERPSLPSLPVEVYERWSPAFDAIEVNTSLGAPEQFTADGAVLRALAADAPTDVPVLADWFGLLGAGLPVAAMGNSDTHSINEGVGYPRTYLHVGSDVVGDIDEAGLTATIRAQRTLIAEGCLLTLTADGALRFGKAELVDADAALRVRLQAPPHVEDGRLELYANGVAQLLSGDIDSVSVDAAGALSLPLAGIAATGAERLAHTIAGLPVDVDTVLVAVSRGGRGLAPTGGNAVTCVSQALYVDGDGDGAFSPWLADTEDVSTER